jgi:hypothetical protein
MRLYSLRRGFLQRVRGRRLSPLSTRVWSLWPESLFERRENETSSWNPSLGATADYAFDLGPSDRKDSTSLQGPRLLRCGFSVRPMTASGQTPGLMLAARITLAHFSVSSAMCLPKSLGEPGSTVPPSSARHVRFSILSDGAIICDLCEILRNGHLTKSTLCQSYLPNP